MREITNCDKIIDSRDLIEYIEYLEDVINDESFDEDKEELEKLKEFKNEIEETFSAEVMKYGVCLINDDYFEEYAQELAEDVGAIDRNQNWPANHIDWNAAAEQLKQNYTEVEFDGQSFWG